MFHRLGCFGVGASAWLLPPPPLLLDLVLSTEYDPLSEFAKPFPLTLALTLVTLALGVGSPPMSVDPALRRSKLCGPQHV